MGPTNFTDPRLKKRLAALAELESGLPALDYDVETPAGQLNVSRKPLEHVDPENLEVAGPVSGLGQSLGGRLSTAAPPAAPPPPSDLDLLKAQGLDRDSGSDRLFETATRQLIGGLTRTAPQATLTQQSTNEAQLLAKRRQAQMDALKELELGTQAKRFDYEKQRDADRLERDRVKDERDFAYRQQHDKDTLDARNKDSDSRLALSRGMFGLAVQGNERAKAEADAKKEARDDKAAANVFPLVGGTFTIKKGLDDSAANKARTDGGMWNQAIGNIDSLQGSLSGYIQKPSLEGKAQVEAQLQGALTALNAAYGQGAMADNERKALSQALGADVMTPTGIIATVQSWLSGDAGQAGQLLLTKIRTLREAARKSALQKLSPYGEFADGSTRAAAPATGPDEDAAAVEWAKANKSDPRAAEILRLHGVK